MAFNTMSTPRVPTVVVEEDISVSAVSWAAVFAGAFGAVAVSVILIELGLGLGFASVSPWTTTGRSLATLGVMGGVWLIITQWISAGIGGYLAGRLRTKWMGVHTDEVFFRDTAHGFLAWSLATTIGVVLIAAGSASLLNAGGRAVGGAASGIAAGGIVAASSQGQQMRPLADPYFVDLLFRPAPATATATAATVPSGNGGATSSTSTAAGGPGAAAAPTGAVSPMAVTTPSPTATPGNVAGRDDRGAGEDRAITNRIFVRDLPTGALTQDDRAYLVQTIAARTGISQDEAGQRVDATVAQIKTAEDQAKQAADKARKAAAFGSIVTALAMVIGAFIASVAGAMGGRLRDEYHP